MRQKLRRLRTRRLLLLVCAALLPLLFGLAGASAQVTPFSAQIQRALAAFKATAQTFTSTQTFTNLTVTGTCTGCGGTPGGSTNQAQFNNAGVFAGTSLIRVDTDNRQIAIVQPDNLSTHPGTAALYAYGENSSALDDVLSVGLATNADIDGAGNITTADAVQAQISVGGTGNIVNGAGVHILSGYSYGMGTIATNYGLRIDNITTGTTKYAIYTGTGAVRLGDALTVTGGCTGCALSGTTGAIGGGALAAGACASGTATVTGATTDMAIVVTPVTYPGDGTDWKGYVSSANTITVKVCALVVVTPTSSNYNVRVLP